MKNTFLHGNGGIYERDQWKGNAEYDFRGSSCRTEKSAQQSKNRSADGGGTCKDHSWLCQNVHVSKCVSGGE